MSFTDQDAPSFIDRHSKEMHDVMLEMAKIRNELVSMTRGQNEIRAGVHHVVKSMVRQDAKVWNVPDATWLAGDGSSPNLQCDHATTAHSMGTHEDEEIGEHILACQKAPAVNYLSERSQSEPFSPEYHHQNCISFGNADTVSADGHKAGGDDEQQQRQVSPTTRRMSVRKSSLNHRGKMTRSNLHSESGVSDLMRTASQIVGSDSDVLYESMESSRCSFGAHWHTESRDAQMLREMFQVAEKENDRLAELHDHGIGIVGRLKKEWLLMRSWSSETIEMVMDSWIGGVIMLNALFIGISMDLEDGGIGWLLADLMFLTIYIVEIGTKLRMLGRRRYVSKKSNLFDCSVVGVDLIQVLVALIFPSAKESLEKTPSASLLRVLRLGKLLRVARVLRSPLFKDLLAMMQGMSAGMTTLGWAIILFVGMVYVIALILREVFGRSPLETSPTISDDILPFFNSVPRSMFTTFRCSFGDCNTDWGTPIFEAVYAEYGQLYSCLYFLFVFIVTIGLFNVISAIFVQSVTDYFTSLSFDKKKARLNDDVLWCVNVAVLVRRLLAFQNGDVIQGKLSDSTGDLYNIIIDVGIMDKLAMDPQSVAAFEALDIAAEDRECISEILDPDNNGEINIIEMVEGIGRLRGNPRRSDIVTVNLMLRSLQRDLTYAIDRIDTKSGVPIHMPVRDDKCGNPALTTL